MRLPVKIYLTDPIHNYIGSKDNWMIPLNVLNLSACAKEQFGDDVDIRCFKFPDQVLDAIEADPPDIIGTSNYIWNAELSKLILEYAREQRPDTLTLMGGPNIIEDQAWMTEFLASTECDIYTQGDGELPFSDIISAYLKHGGDRIKVLEGVGLGSVWIKTAGAARFVPAREDLKDLDRLPSPFAMGLADEFLDQGLIANIETNRGCPFSCTYCVWGTGHAVRQFDIERVKSDLDHCRRRSKDGQLMINDANFGLFGRDLEIAGYLKELSDEHGWPTNVVVNWGQVRSEKALEIANTLRGVCIFRQSSQSMDPEVLKNINRKNVSAEQWRTSISHCKEQGVESFGELILMLPGESLASYLEGLRILFSYDVDCINTNQLQLLNGAPMNTPEERRKYGMKTKWRLFENAYGIYKGKTAIESVELVCETNSFQEEQCYLTRPLSWLIQMSWTLHRHDLLIRLLSTVGVNPVDFFMEVLNQASSAAPAVAQLFDEFMQDTRNELYDSQEELVAHYATPERMEALREGDFKKLNTHYSSYLPELNVEFMDLYKSVARSLCASVDGLPEHFMRQIDECCEYLLQRNINASELEAVEAGKSVRKRMDFHFDFLRWSRDTKGTSLAEAAGSTPFTYEFYVSDQQKDAICGHMRKFSGISREYQLRKLHEPFYGIHKKHLLFNIKPA
ncbi:B12-binding domain-containing radical SAM protein [Pseudodesulfovibrio sp.]|uniref:B12-binding domain-containing radical SAM protein n=1 Tax=unclassified Pseudodesulfovibrio TaxID=2661612 RepID=UPI003B00592C